MIRNPLEAGQHLLKQYRAKLRFALESNELTTEAIEQILDSIQTDSGIYLSLNPFYEQSEEPFANFVRQHRLPEKLVPLFPKLAEKGLYTHQNKGILSILDERHTIISTGTGSGKTETFLIPIIAHCLQSMERGVKAIIVYPMNALAGDQIERIAAYTQDTNITFGLYTGATPENPSAETLERKFANHLIYRDEMRANPPDILITNYVMLDRMLTREKDHRIFIESSGTLRYLVLDELHTYTGSKAAHLKYLLARLSHYFTNKVVYIGTSATLASDAAGKSRLDEFLQNLFGISPNEYDFIEAIKKAENRLTSIQSVPDLSDDDLESMDFSTEEKAATSISLLAGTRIDTFDFYTPSETFHQTPVYQSLFTNHYVAIIRHALEQSSQSFTDLVRHISHGMPTNQFQLITPERLLASCLEAIAYINEKVGERGKPLLDYRLHVFVQNLTGVLKMCPVCRRYFSGDVAHCPHDGQTIFAVYRHDVRLCIGKVNGQKLSPIIEAESTDLENVHYVFIGRVTDNLNDDFELQGDLSSDGEFHPFSDGAYRLAHLDAGNPEQLEHNLIRIGDEKRDYLYLFQMVKTMLQTYGKSLGFVDNRELASRYSTIIRDEFASEFLYEFLCLHYPHERDFSIDRTLAYLQKRAGEVDASTLEQAIFNELSIWFYRIIAIPERMGGVVGLLKRRDEAFDWDNLSDLQRSLVDIFIHERAILTGFTDVSSNSRFIRFQKYRATLKRGVFFEDGVSADPNYDGISLGERSREYADFVENWSASGIKQAVDELVDADIIIRETTPDNKTIYYLNREHLCFNLPLSSYGDGEDGYERLKKALLFTAEVHSSDLRTVERERVETGFKRGNIHFVTATPTLEMGIDIGDLESVLMIGAPPTPANYAQRAGRAGRGKKRDALIVTFCSAASTHDVYAFRNPQTVINGRVAPPAFNPANPEILKKHVNAFVLRHHLKNRDTLRQFVFDVDRAYCDQIPQMQVLFGNGFDYTEYLNEFKQLLERIARETDGRHVSLANYCYTEGIFPDYSFRRDQVIAVDVEDRDQISAEQTFDWKDFALTTRDTEQAFRFFVPDQAIYVAGEVYKTLSDGIYEILSDGAHQYSCFFAQKEVRFAQQRKEIKHLDLRQYFNPTVPNLEELRGVLAIGHTDECILSFRNYGVRRSRQKSSPSETQTLIGYDLKREAVVLRFDALICNDILRNSLTAVLVREINRRYGLADGEIRLMLEAKLPNEADNSRWIYTLFYDNDGNNNLPLQTIYQDFNLIIRSAYEQLLSCTCETDGCYQCIRSYNTQYFDATLSKDRALMFAGYLSGERRFEPSVVPFVPRQSSFDLILTVRQQNNEIMVTSSTGGNYRQRVQDALNDTIFTTLTQAVYGEYQTGKNSLKIETWVDWLADSINNRRVNKGKDAFNRFQFALLKFDRVEAFHDSTKRKVGV